MDEKFRDSFKDNASWIQLSVQPFAIWLVYNLSRGINIPHEDEKILEHYLNRATAINYSEFDLPHCALYLFAKDADRREISQVVQNLEKLTPQEKVTAAGFFEKFCDAEKIGESGKPLSTRAFSAIPRSRKTL